MVPGALSISVFIVRILINVYLPRDSLKSTTRTLRIRKAAGAIDQDVIKVLVKAVKDNNSHS